MKKPKSQQIWKKTKQNKKHISAVTFCMGYEKI